MSSNDDYGKIQSMLNDSGKTQDFSNKNSNPSQLQKLTWMMIHLAGGLIGIFVLAIIYILTDTGSFGQLSRIIVTSRNISIPIAVLGLLWLAASQGAASTQMSLEFTRRAWTKQPHNEDFYGDYQRMIDYGGWVVGYFWAALFYIIYAYYQGF